MAENEYKWDLFISYARENQDFVRKELVEPLRGYRTADGRPVKAFVDILALRAGVNWMIDVTNAIHESRVFIAVYSEDYFKSEACMWELAGGVGRDLLGLRGMFRPVAISSGVASLVPKAYDRFNWANASEEGWYERLIEALEYRHHGRICVLEFGAEIQSVTAGIPLSPVRVDMLFEDRRVEEPEDIGLFSEKGTLRGTTTMRSQHGQVLFQDLFFDTPVESTRLVAMADGCSASLSNAFSVLSAPVIQTPKEDPRIDASGDVFFFGDPEVIGVVSNGALQIFTLTGSKVGRAAIPRRVRLARPCAGGLTICGWDGQIVWVGSNGVRREWWPCKTAGFCVAGDLTAAPDGGLFVGMWSGEVWSLQPDGATALLLRHPGGIQSLEIKGSEMYVADLDGNLAVYVGQQRTVTVRTEPTIRRLKVFQDSAILIGEEQLYQYSILQKKIFSVPLPMTERIAAVFGIGEKSLAVSARGRCIVFTKQDTSQTFWTTLGCVPVSMDEEGRLFVFRNPDSSYSLWHDRRPLLQGIKGGMAVSQSGSHVAIGEGTGLKISSMESLLGSGSGGDVGQA